MQTVTHVLHSKKKKDKTTLKRIRILWNNKVVIKTVGLLLEE